MKEAEHDEADVWPEEELVDEEEPFEWEPEERLSAATKVGVVLWWTLVVVVVGTLLVVLARYVAGWLGISEVALVVAYVGLVLVMGVVLSNVSLNRDVQMQARLMALLLRHQVQRDARSESTNPARAKGRRRGR